MARAEDYIELFGKLENQLKVRAGIDKEHIEILSVVRELVNNKRDRIVIRYENDIKSHAALRNVIVHNYSKDPIADPRQDIVDSLKDLINSLQHPLLAQDIMIPNPTVFNINDSVKKSITLISSKGFTSVPVYDEDGIVGILSERSAVNWVGDMLHDEEVLLNQVTMLSDIKKYFDPISGGDDIYKFATRNQDAFSIKDMFNDAILQGKRLAAVFITQNGKQTEKMIGIITAWDLHKIDK